MYSIHKTSEAKSIEEMIMHVSNKTQKAFQK
jgi:hypothetical protein